MNDPQLQHITEMTRTALAGGDYFKAYDTAIGGLSSFPGSLQLQHLAVLALARAGATGNARVHLINWRLRNHSNHDIAALHARLLKDEGMAAENEDDRRWYFDAAASTYRQLYDRTQDPYPGINAATMLCLSGQRSDGRILAQEVLRRLDDRSTASVGKAGYWHHVTAAEAYLLLDRTTEAEQSLRSAVSLLPDDISERAVTCKQLFLIADILSLDKGWIEEFRPPAPVHFTGLWLGRHLGGQTLTQTQQDEIVHAISRALADAPVGDAFGGLLPGGEILLAEEFLRRGHSLKVVLPCGVEEFVERFVSPAAGDWTERFQSCVARAGRLVTASEELQSSNGAVRWSGTVAMGLTAIRASELGVQAIQFVVGDDFDDSLCGSDTAAWRAAKLPQSLIRLPNDLQLARGVRDRPADTAVAPVALLLIEVIGACNLSAEQVATIKATISAPLRRIAERYGKKCDDSHFIDGGVVLAFADVQEAAHCAVALHREAAGIPKAFLGLPLSVGVRIGGHLVSAAANIVQAGGNDAFDAAYAQYAARIERIAPVEIVYVTAPFAAALALSSGGQYWTQYAGTPARSASQIVLPLFSLRKRSRYD